MAALNDPNFDFWFFFRLLGLTIDETKDINGYRMYFAKKSLKSKIVVE